MTTKTNEMFENEAKRLSDGYKKGYFGKFGNLGKCGYVGIKWYFTRGTERKPIICVTHIAETESTYKFPFTAEGLEAAIELANNL